MATEVTLSKDTFIEKREQFRTRYHNQLTSGVMILSDEEASDYTE